MARAARSTAQASRTSASWTAGESGSARSVENATQTDLMGFHHATKAASNRDEAVQADWSAVGLLSHEPAAKSPTASDPRQEVDGNSCSFSRHGSRLLSDRGQGSSVRLTPVPRLRVAASGWPNGAYARPNGPAAPCDQWAWRQHKRFDDTALDRIAGQRRSGQIAVRSSLQRQEPRAWNYTKYLLGSSEQDAAPGRPDHEWQPGGGLVATSRQTRSRSHARRPRIYESSRNKKTQTLESCVLNEDATGPVPTALGGGSGRAEQMVARHRSAIGSTASARNPLCPIHGDA